MIKLLFYIICEYKQHLVHLLGVFVDSNGWIASVHSRYLHTCPLRIDGISSYNAGWYYGNPCEA